MLTPSCEQNSQRKRKEKIGNMWLIQTTLN